MFHLMEHLDPSPVSQAAIEPTPAVPLAEGEPATATVDRALVLLQELGREGAALGVSELARRVGLPKASTHRLLSTLARRGFVEREERRYRLGFVLVALGAAAARGDALIGAARPALEAGAADVGETFFLVAERAGTLVVLDKVEGSGFVRAAPQVGAVVPSHATAVGKLYRAFAPDRLPHGIATTRFTEHTPGPRALAHDVAQARERGFALNRDEWIEGLAVVAAPIFRPGRGADGRELAGALAVAASTPAMDRLGAERVAEDLRERAAAVTRRLGTESRREER